MSETTVWIEAADGRRWPVLGNCAIGRSTSNDLVIEDGRVSRRHALIHKQDDDEFWVIDLGSGNGTYLNDRRVTLSTRLADGDVLMFGGWSFTFRQAAMPKVGAGGRRITTAVTEQTIIQVKTLSCWLLVADIKGSTALAHSLTTTELAMLVGRWMATCKEIVEGAGGQINKYLGDGFFAYWAGGPRDLPGVTRAMRDLMQLQAVPEGPPFRLALHHGTVAIGGTGASGEDSLSGPEVIRVFRMEKLASALRRDVLVSAEAQAMPGLALALQDEGQHVLPDFDGRARRFYSA